MRYFKRFKESGAEAVEITKEEARRTLNGWWTDECLDDIFDNERGFCLYTPRSEVWTKTEDGLVPMAGFYGIVG